MTEQERQAALDALKIELKEDAKKIEEVRRARLFNAAISAPAPVPVIDGLDEAIKKYDSGYLCNTGGKYNDVAWQAARAYAALPKLQKVDLDACFKDLSPYVGSKYDILYGYNSAIADIKAKYGELYTEVK